MKKLLITLIAVLLLIPVNIKAIPAFPYPNKVVQPDGSNVTLCIHGDEFMNYTTTEDGYTVVQNNKGFYVYAKLENDQLFPTDYIAKDTSRRSSEDKKFLKNVSKQLCATPIDVARLQRASANRNYKEESLLKANKPGDHPFRGLVILVEFTNRKFVRDDIKEVFSDMMNKQNYTGFMNGFEHIDYTGSVRDFFNANSKGQFDPSFDVVGPVQINFTQTYIQQTKYAGTIMQAACIAAAPLVNFSDYDQNRDGIVDMVYFVFAGGGSNVSGNNENYVWPHASSMWGVTQDGVYLGRYACSTEFYGREDAKILDGIGTVCHEFSHVLGLPDLYDTDYKDSGGQSVHPQQWSIMAGGSYLNKSRTPCSFSLYERYALGWATPQLIKDAGTFTMDALNTSNTGYRIESSIQKEFFLLENRQQTGWDEYLPGHGMLVFRVDSTDASVWNNNTLNTDPNHQYYELIRANRRVQSGNVIDSSSDPFPGTSQIKSLTNNTIPNISSWTTAKTEIIITDIVENAGVISFKTGKEKLEFYMEDFEDMAITTGDATGIQGKFSKWDFKNVLIQKPGKDKANGSNVIGAYKNGEIITTTPLDADVSAASFMLWNPTTQSVMVRFYYSLNSGSTWIAAKTYAGNQYEKLSSGEFDQITFSLNTKEPVTFKIFIFSGSSTEMCYIDDFTLKYDAGPNGIAQTPVSEGDKHLTVYQVGDCVTVESEDRLSDIILYSGNGVQLACRKLRDEGKAVFKLPSKGFYILYQGGKNTKIVY